MSRSSGDSFGYALKINYLTSNGLLSFSAAASERGIRLSAHSPLSKLPYVQGGVVWVDRDDLNTPCSTFYLSGANVTDQYFTTFFTSHRRDNIARKVS